MVHLHVIVHKDYVSVHGDYVVFMGTISVFMVQMVSVNDHHVSVHLNII